MTRHLASALLVVVLSSCGGTSDPPVQTTTVNDWLCGNDCVVPGHCVDLGNGLAYRCVARIGYRVQTGGTCSPADCTATAPYPTEPCAIEVTCPVR